MKVEIKSLSAHQTSKVFSILMFAVSLVFIIPMMLMMFAISPGTDAHGNAVKIPYAILIAMPFIYLIFGYVMTIIMCKIYNVVTGFVGGFEFEIKEKG